MLFHYITKNNNAALQKQAALKRITIEVLLTSAQIYLF